MIEIFRAGAISRTIIALLLLLLIRIPAIVSGIPLITPELKWMLVGERMARGYMVYTQIWDNTAPLAAAVYWVIDLVFGRSQLAYQLIALLLVILQTLYFNFSLNRNQLFPERSNLPALLYVVGMSLFFDFYTLSPMLLGVSFLLLALDAAFRSLSRDTDSDEAFAVGFYIGLATLCYLPLAWFEACAAAGFLFLSAIRFRKFFLLTFGFIFPLAVAYLFFYLLNGQQALYLNWLIATISLGTNYYISFGSLLVLFAPFMVLLVVSLVRIFGGEARFINYQIRVQQFMFLWLIFAVLTLFFANDLLPLQGMVFVPVVAFFGTHYFLLIRKVWMGELVFWAVFLCVLLFNYAGLHQLPRQSSLADYSRLVVEEVPEVANLRGKNILVLGETIEEYRHNTPATPYLNWTLSRRHFEDLDNFVSVISLFENFQDDPPQVIVDKKKVVPKLFSRLPALSAQYQRQGNSNVYLKREKTTALGNK